MPLVEIHVKALGGYSQKSIRRAHRILHCLYGIIVIIVVLWVLWLAYISQPTEGVLWIISQMVFNPYFFGILVFLLLVFAINHWEQREPKEPKLSRKERKWEKRMEEDEP